ncbi:MAG: amino acid dehydrogenase [Rhodocyclales bacterium RIFCSPLOWO2_02_FULL_63_24]|nr:MAG: amino acid dehydrogenase [Rhodocyclales bacterium GWA2_65_19]OHC67466.1 MAG: amino acid dehydrogenase [Rhodocyclales bacterium RIFCSPLOWO2_02_FULL_63_24]
MRITVLGAGVVGVTSAWYLAADGHEVTVIDRQPQPAQETSFANGGQISVSHAEPWANPGAPLKALQWLGREDAPLLWRLRADPAQWAWGWRFLRECTAPRARANVGAIVRLGLASRAALQALRRDLALEYDHLERGILHFYTDPREFEHALPQAALMREFGCERVPKTAAECLAIEPALAASRVRIVGGTYTASDESGDARRFTQALAQHATARGVCFRHGETVAALLRDGGRLAGIRLASGELLRADITVLALGSYSPLLLRPLGVSLPVYPAKGYSATLALTDGVTAPSVSLTDDGHKIVISRLGQALRVAGTAEFNGYDVSLNAARCAALLRRTREIFPALEAVTQVDYWAGLRPATPGNVPVIGDMAAAGLAGLWLNTGHGTLGWTLACGSAKLLADLAAGRDPGLETTPYRFQ